METTPERVITPRNEIRAWMALTGRTQAALAAEIGITAPYLSGVLNGHKGLSLRRALKAARISGLPIELWADLRKDADEAAA